MSCGFAKPGAKDDADQVLGPLAAGENDSFLDWS